MLQTGTASELLRSSQQQAAQQLRRSAARAGWCPLLCRPANQLLRRALLSRLFDLGSDDEGWQEFPDSALARCGCLHLDPVEQVLSSLMALCKTCRATLLVVIALCSKQCHPSLAISVSAVFVLARSLAVHDRLQPTFSGWPHTCVPSLRLRLGAAAVSVVLLSLVPQL